MKLGLGLYKHMLTDENFRFAKQAGATHIVAHFVDYFRGSGRLGNDDQPIGDDQGWGIAGDPDTLWSLEQMVSLKKELEGHDLVLEAIENFDPAHWHDILLDGPKRAEHIENVKTIIRRMGEAGIPIMGYNFSIAGVAGRSVGPYARGGALSVGMEGSDDKPMPRGMVWNMVYDENAPTGSLEPVSSEQLWDRLQRFLNEVLPVAEEAGVVLAAHPDDPPMPTVRKQPRLVYQPKHYQKLIDLNTSQCNQLEFCIGSIAEMTEGNVYDVIDHYAKQKRLGYVHFRNVRGKVPTYKETFIDDGDIDMVQAIEILCKNDFTGVLIPDHCPAMSCDSPWHAGMAYSLGFMRGVLKSLKI